MFPCRKKIQKVHDWKWLGLAPRLFLILQKKLSLSELPIASMSKAVFRRYLLSGNACWFIFMQIKVVLHEYCCSRTIFETEAKGNSEIVYLTTELICSSFDASWPTITVNCLWIGNWNVFNKTGDFVTSNDDTFPHFEITWWTIVFFLLVVV